MVLGDDLHILFDLLHPVQSCNEALTRAQAKQGDVDSLPFYGVELETQPVKFRKSCGRKRQEKFQHTVTQPSAEAAPNLSLGSLCRLYLTT